MILYHFTSFAALKRRNPKLFDGVQAGDSFWWTDDLEPGPNSWRRWRDVIIGVETLPPVVWLTSDPNPKNALPTPADLRFKLALGSHLNKLIRFEDYLIKNMGPEQVKKMFSAPAVLGLGSEGKQWWLYLGTIPCERIRALEEI
jgi:hypothetical protein